jgi:hypothetical protein
VQQPATRNALGRRLGPRAKPLLSSCHNASP